MIPFKRFFTEALSLSDVRKHKLSRKTSGAYLGFLKIRHASIELCSIV